MRSSSSFFFFFVFFAPLYPFWCLHLSILCLRMGVVVVGGRSVAAMVGAHGGLLLFLSFVFRRRLLFSSIGWKKKRGGGVPFGATVWVARDVLQHHV